MDGHRSVSATARSAWAAPKADAFGRSLDPISFLECEPKSTGKVEFTPPPSVTEQMKVG